MPRSLAELLSVLGDPDPQIVVAALKELAALGREATAALPSLLPLFSHPEMAVRNFSARVLSAIDPPHTAEQLTSAAMVAQTRAQALAAMKVYADLQELSRSLAQKHRRPFSPEPLAVELGARAAPLLIELCKSEPELRYDLVILLGLLCSQRDDAFTAVEAYRADPDPFVRRAVALSIWRFGDRAIPTLEVLMQDYGEGDQLAMGSLSLLETPAALKALKKYIRASKPGGNRDYAKEQAKHLEAKLESRG